MSDIAERYERITAQFTEHVRAVPVAAWDNPSPCEGWTARDVVGHLTDWIPAFFGSQGVEFPAVPSVRTTRSAHGRRCKRRSPGH